jgi:hypothetical protein
MRWLGLLTLLCAGVVGLLCAADEKNPNEPVQGFLIHEWGVWRIHDDMELANADMRTQWNELPDFVYGQTTTREFPRHWDFRETKVLKPVLFLHAQIALTAELRVDFPTGVPAVWWPATEKPLYQGGDLSIVPKKPARSLEWKVFLKQSLRLEQGMPEYHKLPKSHWMQTLRHVKCDDVFVSVGERNSTFEREKFIYYDGLLPRVNALAIQIDKENISLKNQEKFTVHDVWVVDNRDAARRRIGRLPRLDAGAAQEVEYTAMPVEEAAKTLTAQLKAAGLNEDEAAALTTIWTGDFFASAGLSLFYRLPQEVYDRLLPLTVKPRPENIVRVGLVQQIPFDNELADRIAKLVKQLNDDRFDKREAAQQQLAKLGPIALVTCSVSGRPSRQPSRDAVSTNCSKNTTRSGRSPGKTAGRKCSEIPDLKNEGEASCAGLDY